MSSHTLPASCNSPFSHIPEMSVLYVSILGMNPLSNSSNSFLASLTFPSLHSQYISVLEMELSGVTFFFKSFLQIRKASSAFLSSHNASITLQHKDELGGKMSLQSCFMADLVYWVSQNPPPVHFFLISGDKDFASILHRLRMNNYNILLASREFIPGILCSSATLMWSWTCLVKGGNASAKHFNHPPDGFYGSWYGPYKAVLDDPFSDMKQVNRKGEDYVELSSESKPRPVPRALVNAIQQILHSYPEGINMSDLRNELKRINMSVDKDFFGYKNFSHLLASMPNILKFITSPGLDGQPLVVGKHLRTADSSPSRFKTIQDFDSSDEGMNPTTKQDGKPPSVTPNNDMGLTPTTLDKHPSSYTSTQYDVDEGGVFEKFKRYFFRFQHLKETSPLTTKGNDMEANHDVSTSKKRKKIIVKGGFLQRIWEGLNHSSADLPVRGINSISGLDSTSNKDSVEAKSTYEPTEKLKCEAKKTNWKNKFSPSKSFREFGESPATDKTTRHPDMHTGPPDTKQSFFKSIAGWWSKKSEKDQEGVCEPRKEVTTEDNFVHHTETIGVFSKGYFWDALESFLLTSKGAELISKSRTREQLVHGLQKGCPWVLKDLSKAQLFELVNLMIVEKKWIEESILQMFPFRLTLAKQKCVTSHSYNSNGLSSLFAGKISKSSAHRQPEQETYGHKSGSLGSSFAVTNSVNQRQNFLEFKSWFQKTYIRKEDVQPEDLERMFESMFSIKLVPSSYGYPDLQSLIEVFANDDNYENRKRKSSPSREKILFDCQKLLVELLDEYPDGFNMSIFKPAFLQRYGYALEFQTLGYPKLASLLEIMLPGVRIESSFVIPAERFCSNSSSTNEPTIGTLDLTSLDDKGNAGNNTGRESASEDCAWEELGPVHETVVREHLTAAPIKDREVAYDESLSDDELSYSEGDTPPLQDVVEKSQRCGEESSLIQILDSWYGSKGDGLKKSSKDGCGVEQAEVIDGLVDCSTNKPEIVVDIKPK